MSYDEQRIKDIQEKLSCAMQCIEEARLRGDADIMESCEYLAASYTKKLGELINRGLKDEKQEHAAI